MGKSTVKILEGGFVGAILWAVAMGAGPQLSQAHEEGRLDVMVQRLHEVRTAISQYQGHHDGLLPGQSEAGETVEAEAFCAALTSLREDGGRYLTRIPDNPFIRAGELKNRILVIHNLEADCTGPRRAGWCFNSATGQFTACDSKFHAAY